MTKFWKPEMLLLPMSQFPCKLGWLSTDITHNIKISARPVIHFCKLWLIWDSQEFIRFVILIREWQCEHTGVWLTRPGSHPPIRRSVLWSLALAVCMSKYPQARNWTEYCKILAPLMLVMSSIRWMQACAVKVLWVVFRIERGYINISFTNIVADMFHNH